MNSGLRRVIECLRVRACRDSRCQLIRVRPQFEDVTCRPGHQPQVLASRNGDAYTIHVVYICCEVGNHRADSSLGVHPLFLGSNPSRVHHELLLTWTLCSCSERKGVLACTARDAPLRSSDSAGPHQLTATLKMLNWTARCAAMGTSILEAPTAVTTRASL